MQLAKVTLFLNDNFAEHQILIFIWESTLTNRRKKFSILLAPPATTTSVLEMRACNAGLYISEGNASCSSTHPILNLATLSNKYGFAISSRPCTKEETVSGSAAAGISAWIFDGLTLLGRPLTRRDSGASRRAPSAHSAAGEGPESSLADMRTWAQVVARR